MHAHGKRPLATLVGLPAVVGVVAAGLIIAAMRGGGVARRLAAGRPFVALLAGALTIGGLAVLTRAGTGVDVSTVLFSGQQSLSTVTASTAAGTLLVVAVVKSAAGMPVTALVLALLLCVSAGPAVTVPAILGALVGTLLKGLLNARRPATVES